ncbi:MAG: hypothetical protein JSV27_02150 [Candidatus Bathyarchaeota archaeon]|nr:MAG: hypothetical protein JSV27_02150 [Candidatus Bathyarchaeota archaeon]
MRTYIFTDKERNIIETYLRDGTELEGYNVLLLRLSRHIFQINNDFELATRFLLEIAEGPERR